MQTDQTRSAGSIARAVLLGTTLFTVATPAHESLQRNIDWATAQIERAPDDATLYLRRGELHRLHRDWARALADLRLAMELAPERADFQYYLGRTLLEAGHIDDALTALDRYLARAPDRAPARVARARALTRLGRAEEAVGDYDRALALRPDPETYLARAKLMLAVGAHDDALAGLDEGVARLGDIPALVEHAITIELDRGRPEAALARLEAVIARAPAPAYWRARRAAIADLDPTTQTSRAAALASEESP